MTVSRSQDFIRLEVGRRIKKFENHCSEWVINIECMNVIKGLEKFNRNVHV